MHRLPLPAVCVLPVLDHGQVRLVDFMGSDLSIVRNARVSHDAAWRTGEDAGKDEKLIHYLYNNQHNTPFEAVVFTFEIKAPIFVVRQWHRHRTWSYNEVSARYTELPEEYYIPRADVIGRQSKTNHQSRDIGEVLPDDELLRAAQVMQAMESSHVAAFGLYKILLNGGVPRELARSVLPVSAYTRMFATVNLNNLFKFLHERMDGHAQYEIRVYAEALAELIQPIVPVAMEAFTLDFRARQEAKAGK